MSGPSADGQGFDDPEQDDVRAVGDSYAVATFEQARTSLAIVDTWASRISAVRDRSEAAHDQQLLREDGESLLAAFERQAMRLAEKSTTIAIGPRLAAEELRLLLKHAGDKL